MWKPCIKLWPLILCWFSCSSAAELGCYSTRANTTTSGRTAAVSPGFYSGDLTVEKCRLMCTKTGQSHASLLNGNLCMCGGAPSSDTVTVDKCGKICAGDSNKCGDETYVTIHTVINSAIGLSIDYPNNESYHQEAFKHPTTNVSVSVKLGTDVRYNYSFGDGDTDSTTNTYSLHTYKRIGQTVIHVEAAASEQILKEFTTKEINLFMAVKNLSIDCPASVQLNTTFECTFQLLQGSASKLVISFGDGRIVPLTPPDATPFDIGMMSAAASTAKDTAGKLHFLKNHAFRHSGTVAAVEVFCKIASTKVIFEIYRPFCSGEETYFCLQSHKCLKSATECRAQPGRTRCATDTIYSFRLRKCVSKSTGEVVLSAVPGSAPAYKYVPGTDFECSGVVSGLTYCKVPDVLVKSGDIPVIDRESSMTVGTFASSGVSSITKAADNDWTERESGSFKVESASLQAETVDFYIKFYVIKPVVNSLSHRYIISDNDANFTITANATSHNEYFVTDSKDIEVLTPISNVTFQSPPKGKTHWDLKFNIPEHPGTRPRYLWNFGDGTVENTTGRNVTHRYLEVGFYIINLTAYNGIGEQSYEVNITIQDTISHVSIDADDQPATKLGQLTKLAIAVTQGTKGTYEVDFGDGKKEDLQFDSFNVNDNHLMYFSKSASRAIVSTKQATINTIDQNECAKACLLHTDFRCLSFQASDNCVIQIEDTSTPVFGFRHDVPGTTLYFLKRDICVDDLVKDLPKEHFIVSSGDWQGLKLESGTAWVASTSDYAQIQLDGPSVISAVHSGINSAKIGEGVTSFTLSYSEDGRTWANYSSQIPVTVSDSDTTLTAITSRVTALYVRIYPIKTTISGALRVGLRGCGQIRETKELSHMYGNTGSYKVTLTANNLVSDLTASTTVRVEKPLQKLEVPVPSAIEYGKEGKVIFAATQGSDIVVEGTLETKSITKIDYNTSGISGRLVIKSEDYDKIGSYALNMTLANFVTTPKNVQHTVWVDYPITNARVTVDKNYSNRTKEVDYIVTMDLGSRVNVTWDFGDGQYDSASNLLLFSNGSHDVKHSYDIVGAFVANVTMENHLSKQAQSFTVIVQNPINSLELVTNNPVSLSAASVGAAKFKVVYSGNVNDKPTNVSGRFVFGDGSVKSAVLHFTGNEFTVNHEYGNYSTYDFTVDLSNQVSSTSLSAKLDVDKPITGAEIFSDKPYYKTGETVNLLAVLKTGTRVNYKVNWLDGAVENVQVSLPINESFSHSYKLPLQYSISINYSNSIGSKVVTLAEAITVENPISGTLLVGKSFLEFPLTGSPSATFELWIEKGIDKPSSPNCSIDWDDGGDLVSFACHCQSDGTIPGNDTYYKCISLPVHTFSSPRLYNITMNISNDVSSSSVGISTVFHQPITSLGITVYYDDPYTQSNRSGVSSGSDLLFPIENGILFEVEHKTGNNLIYTWTFGDETPNELVREVSSVAHNFSSINTYSITVVASDPLHRESVTKTIKLIHGISNLQLIIWTPMPKNTTYSIRLEMDSAGTDACYKVDLAVEDAKRGRYLYFGQEAACKTHFGDFVSGGDNFEALDETKLRADKFIYIWNNFPDVISTPITAFGKNLVSDVQSTTLLIVTKGPCFFPKVDLNTPNRCNIPDLCTKKNLVGIRKNYKSRDLFVSSDVAFNCSNTKIGHFFWTVEQFKLDTKSWDDISVRLRNANITLESTKAYTLTVPKRFLDYGTYRFNLNVSMDNETGLWGTDSVVLMISKTPLTAGIRTNTIPFESNVTIDALSETFDLDTEESEKHTDLHIRWFCKMTCESWPVFENDYKVTKNGTNNCNGSRDEIIRNNGCFVQERAPRSPMPGELPRDHSNQFLIYGYEENHNLWMNTSFLFEKTYIDLMIVVTKGSRKAVAHKTLRVMLGKPPDLYLTCVTNCYRDLVSGITKLNPVSRFSVRSGVNGFMNGVTYIYSWSLYNDTKEFNYPNKDDFKLPPEKWQGKASTGLNGSDMCIEKDLFIKKDYSKRYRLIQECYREGAEEAIGSVEYRLEINEPPNVDNASCIVTPDNGTALKTKFSIICEGFKDPDLPMTYAFGYSTRGLISDINWVGVYGKPELTNDIILPEGQNQNNVSIYVKVYDGVRSFVTVLCANVTVWPSDKSMDVGSMLEDPTKDPTAGMNPVTQAQFFLAVVTQYNENEGGDNSKDMSKEETSKALEKSTKFRESTMSRLDNQESVEPNVDNVKLFATTVASVVSVKTEISSNALLTAQSIAGKLNTALDALVDDPNMDADAYEDASRASFQLIGNMFVASAFLTDQGFEKMKSNETTDQKKSKEYTALARKLTEQNNKMVSNLAKNLMSFKVIGEDATVVETSYLTVVVKKDKPEKYIGQTMQISNNEKSCASFGLGNNDELFGYGNHTAYSVGSKMTQIKSNPYTWSTEASRVSSPVNSLEFTNESGVPFNISDTSDDITIWVDSGDEQMALEPAIGWTIIDKKNLQMNSFQINITEFGSLFVSATQFSNITSYLRNVTDANGDVTLVRHDVNYSENLTFPNGSLKFEIYVRKDDKPTRKAYDLTCTLPRQLEQEDTKVVLVNGVKDRNNSSSQSDRCRKMTKTPSDKICFWDHEMLNLTNEISTFYVGVVAYFVNDSDSNNLKHYVEVQHSLDMYSSSCRYWDETEDTWSGKGCRVGPLSSTLMTQCLCNHLTSFSNMFVVPMNVPNFADLSSLSSEGIAENPVALAFIVTLLCLFVICGIWARWMDLKDIMKLGTTPLAGNNSRDKYMYEVTVCTGYAKNAATTANVSITLVGDERESEPRTLEDQKRKILQVGQTNTFLLTTPRSLGKLSHLRIWHDNSGKSPAWYFSRMMVEDIQTGDKCYFISDRWLAVEEDDGQIDRIIPVAGPEELTSFNYLLGVKARKNLTDDHLWFSVVTRPPRSRFTRVQRLTCILSLLFTTMFASILFFGQEDTVKTPMMIELGPIKFTLHSIYVGVISGLVVVPINIAIVMIFRMLKPMPKFNVHPCCTCCKKKRNTDSDKLLSSIGSETEFSRVFSKEKIPLENYQDKGVFVVGAQPPTQYGGVLQPGYPIDNNTKPQEEAPKPKKKFMLPWWMIFFAYFLALGSVTFCAFYVLLTAGQILGKDKSTDFVLAFLTSCVQSVFLTQPIKIIAVAVFYALFIKKPEAEEDEENEERYLERNDSPLAADEEYIHPPGEDRPRTIVNPPPDKLQLAEARAERLRELEMNKVIKEVSLYITFVVLLIFVIYVNMDPWAFYQNDSVRDVIERGEYVKNETMQDTDMKSVKSLERFWFYIFNSFVPSIYSEIWRNGSLQTNPGDKFVADRNNWLINAPRLRQLRTVANESCTIVKSTSGFIDKCMGHYQMWSQDEGDYKAGWRSINKSDPSDRVGASWHYRSAIDLAGYPHSGRIATYSGGGFVADLGTTAVAARRLLGELYSNSWVDRYTRAVFIEFVTYNPNTNLYTVSGAVLEFRPTGGCSPFPIFHTLRLGMDSGPSLYVVVALEIIVAIAMIYYMVHEIKNLCKIKKPYFKEFWNWVEMALVLLYISTIGMFFGRLTASKVIMKQVEKNANRYVNFQYIVLMEEVYTIICGFVAFFTTLKILKLLRFNKKVSMLSSVLKSAINPVFNFTFMFGIIFFGFVQLAFLLFTSDLSGFKSAVRTIETLFVMLLNKFDFKSFEEGSPIFGPLFFFFFTVLVNFVLINFFITVILESYYAVKHDLEKQANDFEIVEYIMKRFKQFVGTHTARRTGGNVKHVSQETYVKGKEDDPCNQFEDKIEDLLNYLEVFMYRNNDIDKSLLQDVEESQKKKSKKVTCN